MRINTINNDGRCSLSVSFSDEDEERIILQKIIDSFRGDLEVNCLITDLDTSYQVYENYFPSGSYHIIDHLTTVSIFAYALSQVEIQNVISNWGYYTIDAWFAMGTVTAEALQKKADISYELAAMPIVIKQVLDYSVEICFDNCYYKQMLKIFV